jgi:hypothetical protein
MYSGKVVPALEQLKGEFKSGVPEALSENLTVDSKQDVSLLRFKSENAGVLSPKVSNFKSAVALQLAIRGGAAQEIIVIQ